jgi:hypothetical protein
MLLVHIKKYYENITGEEVETMKYNSLTISPVHIHKNKILHKKAILTLGEEIVHHIDVNHAPVVGYSSELGSEKVVAEH